MSSLEEYHLEGREAARRRNLKDFGVDAEAKADRLRDRFKRVSRRLDRTLWARRWRRTLWRWAGALLIPVGIIGGSCLAIATTSPWPISVTIRHLLAAPNCNAARAVGLAPAVRGTPGYWSRHDADDDGIACEPWPRRTLRAKPHRNRASRADTHPSMSAGFTLSDLSGLPQN